MSWQGLNSIILNYKTSSVISQHYWPTWPTVCQQPSLNSLWAYCCATLTISSTHCTYPKRMVRLIWPGWLGLITAEKNYKIS